MASNTCNRPPDYFNGTGSEANYTITWDYEDQSDVLIYVGSPGNWTQYTLGSASNANEYQWQAAKQFRLTY